MSIYYFGVRSTGIYCRPGCPARRPRRAGIAYFASPEAAQAAGYRPCRRCHPDQALNADAGRVEQIRARLDQAEDPADLA